jgi:CRISPR-associated protein Csm3
MTTQKRTFRLLGRLLLRGNIRAVTGLHIGGSPAGLNIGGLDNPVIRDPKTRQPYIPGSSLKGKMRSLSERHRGFDPEDHNQIQQIGQIRIHVCRDAAAYAECPVCQVFGLPGELAHSAPTRLMVRDTFLDSTSLAGAQLDFLFTEVKWEASIDRITSAALPRQVERVPAGAVFAGSELVLSFYDTSGGLERECALARQLLLALQLLEDDALGGLGSRGSGKVRFEQLSIVLRVGSETRPFDDFAAAPDAELGRTLEHLVAAQPQLLDWLVEQLGRPEAA